MKNDLELASSLGRFFSEHPVYVIVSVLSKKVIIANDNGMNLNDLKKDVGAQMHEVVR